jgi:predicted esterase
MAEEHQVSYKTTNTYSTLNTFSAATKNVWLVFHGLGYLSTYFIRYFSHLNAAENYIIALQAPSKYYMGTDFKHVGASWLTRVNTVAETENVLVYVDAVFKAEEIKESPCFIVMGYSQGVSIATRWLASRKIQCEVLLLHSGGIPVELKASDFAYLKSGSKVLYHYGNKDPYISEARKTEEQIKGKKLFGNRLETSIFNGVHEVDLNFIKAISTAR